MEKQLFVNPYKPGAGHMPPYLAGRKKERKEFLQLLEQKVILDNLVLTGLRGGGKTVLLDSFKPLAIQKKWLWVGTDLSESVSVNNDTMAMRFLTDLSAITSDIIIGEEEKTSIGFFPGKTSVKSYLDYNTLTGIFNSIPGLVTDKLKDVFEFVWKCLKPFDVRGIIFAYDEAQTISDHPGKEQYPLSHLLDVFQSIQKKDIPFMLILTGLPTLFPKLVEARTFAERMFKVVFLDKLNRQESSDAIVKPIQDVNCPVEFTDEGIAIIIRESDGYPYFIQFICREFYDILLQKLSKVQNLSPKELSKLQVQVDTILMKLDLEFFSGRWARATDRQRELMAAISKLKNCREEFTVGEVVEISKKCLMNPFSQSHVSQMLVSLTNAGLIYKNRYGKYSFAVPLLDKFILRQNVEGLVV